jgi:hypothetical protein
MEMRKLRRQPDLLLECERVAALISPALSDLPLLHLCWSPSL